METTEYPVGTFAHLSGEWLSMKKQQVKITTYAKYDMVIKKHLIPAIGGAPVDTITEEDLNCVLNRLLNYNSQGEKRILSSSSMKSIVLVSKSIFNYGIKMGVLKINPCHYTVPDTGKKQIDILTRDEQQKLERFLLEENTPSTLGIYICLYSGLRIGEICALRWDDVDMERSLIHVNHTLQRINCDLPSERKTRLIVGTPKSPSSCRMIPLTNQLYSMLSSFKQKNEGIEYVIATPRHPLIEPRTYQYRFERYLNVSQIRKVNFHVLRHTFATRCIESGMDMKTLSEILGHNSVEITMNRYVHPTLEAKRLQLEHLAASLK